MVDSKLMSWGLVTLLAHPYSVVVCQISGAKCFFGGWESHNKYWHGVSIQHSNIWQSDRWTLPFSDLDDHFLLSEWSLYLNHVYHGAYESELFGGCWGRFRGKVLDTSGDLSAISLICTWNYVQTVVCVFGCGKHRWDYWASFTWEWESEATKQGVTLIVDGSCGEVLMSLSGDYALVHLCIKKGVCSHCHELMK